MKRDLTMNECSRLIKLGKLLHTYGLQKVRPTLAKMYQPRKKSETTTGVSQNNFPFIDRSR